MSTGSSDVDEIRREMAKVRRELHEDVQGVVSTAEAATDWRHYLTVYPWASLGAAAVLGYLIVPRRRSHEVSALGVATQADVSKIREAVDEAKQFVAQATQAAVGPNTKKRKKGLIAAGLGLVAPLAIRAAQGYAMKFLENWIVQQQMAHLATSPMFVQPGSPAAPGTARPQRPQQGGGAGSRPL